MLARIQKSMKEKDQGFTLIELLVVMIIIGILAAIAIPVFLSQRKKAEDSAAKADVSTVGKEIATYFVDNTAAPSGVALSALVNGRYSVNGQDAGKASKNVAINTTYGAASVAPVAGLAASMTLWTSSTWCIGLYNSSGSQMTYKYSAQNGLEAGQCTSPSAP
jgi:prepilin-type N-terminal cleavage/methylation domain-containing protein